jgi:hypothetical protein
MSLIEVALAAIESLKLGEKIVYTQIATKYDVNRCTFARRHQRITASPNSEAENQRALHP